MAGNSRKKRVHRDYTELGVRIASLAKNQRELARVLRVSQQTISKKLRGECAILVSDLETIALHYGVKMGWFFPD